jgi:hypothetical protein
MLFEAKYNVTSEHMWTGIISAENGRLAELQRF